MKSVIKPNKLVLIKKNAFGNNIPSYNIKVTLNHGIYINKKSILAYKLINNESVVLINNDNSNVYNIILINKPYVNIDNLNFGVMFLDQKLFDLIEDCTSKNSNRKMPLILNSNSTDFKDNNFELNLNDYKEFKM